MNNHGYNIHLNSRTLTSQTEDWHRSLTIMGISPASVGDQSEVALGCGECSG